MSATTWIGLGRTVLPMASLLVQNSHEARVVDIDRLSATPAAAGAVLKAAAGTSVFVGGRRRRSTAIVKK